MGWFPDTDPLMRGIGDAFKTITNPVLGLKDKEDLDEMDDEMQKGIVKARGDLTPLYEQAIGAYDPYVGMAGQLPGLQQRAMGGEFTPQAIQREQFNFQQDPGYQFAMQQGLQAGERGLAAQGLTGSGRAGKELSRYATGLAGQQYGQAYNRYLQGQQQRLGFNQQAGVLGQQRFGQEAGLGQMGMGALNQQQQARMGLGGLYSDLAIGSAETRANRLGAEMAMRRQSQQGLMEIGGDLYGSRRGGGGQPPGQPPGQPYQSPYAMYGRNT